MKRGEKAEFDEFMLDEATKYGRALTQPEMDTWFANFPTKSMREFRAAWVEHKRDERRGRFFPEIIDIQRVLKSTNDAQVSRDDPRCIWNGNGERCRYPVGWFPLGAHEGYCIFHRSLLSGVGAQHVCDDSQGSTPEQYVERSKAFVYGTELPANVIALQKRLRYVRSNGPVGLFSERLLPKSGEGPGREAADAAIAQADAARMAELNRLAQLAAEDDAA